MIQCAATNRCVDKCRYKTIEIIRTYTLSSGLYAAAILLKFDTDQMSERDLAFR